MPDLTRFAVFATKGRAVPLVPPAAESWQSGERIKALQMNDLRRPFPMFPFETM